MAGLEDLTPDQLRAFNLGKLLLENPEVALEAKRLAKKANPKLQIPEVDIEDRLAAQRTEFQTELERRDQSAMAERVAARKRERDRQIQEAGFTVEEIEKIIVDEKCSYETAMKIAELQQQLATPAAGDVIAGGVPNIPKEMRPEKAWRSLSNGDLRKKSAAIAGEMINDLRSAGRRRAR